MCGFPFPPTSVSVVTEVFIMSTDALRGEETSCPILAHLSRQAFKPQAMPVVQASSDLDTPYLTTSMAPALT